MKLLKKLLLPITLCAVAVSANADMSMPDLSLPNDWQDRLYAGASGGYIQSRDFDGGGGSVRIGYELAKCHYGTHNVEFEFDFLFESGSSSSTSTGAYVVNYPGIPVSSNVTAVGMNTSVDFNQYPLIFNYRFIGNFGDNLPGFMWYIGAGLGVNIINYSNTFSGTVYDSVLGAESFSFSQNDTQGEFIGQGFIGLGYEIMENLAVTCGARILATEQYTFSGNNTLPAGAYSTPALTTTQVQTDTIHWMVEVGVNWMF